MFLDVFKKWFLILCFFVKIFVVCYLSWVLLNTCCCFSYCPLMNYWLRLNCLIKCKCILYFFSSFQGPMQSGPVIKGHLNGLHLQWIVMSLYENATSHLWKWLPILSYNFFFLFFFSFSFWGITSLSIMFFGNWNTL